LGMQLSQAEL